ncbi:NAD(P)H-binding protein [Carboxylicivirga sediminis]|uniref:NAD(P)H-binding protein n=1 Tax=Carboxylicivirga sediminis TaxID=2006564 RepID=A0A941IZE6_9BACT|nr:NAD(P)H-binding protein [Carboxylicivirga sediminis]MBR8536607.1 NAD(P)H-binding protein [Carboxylicivirga sediminis]
MAKTISILGCGWLGLPLASHLVNKGWQVKGSTTSADKVDVLTNIGIEAYEIDITDKASLADGFFKSEYLLVNIPPTKVLRNVVNYHPLVEKIKQSGPMKVIFISSTSVYPSLNQTAHEADTEQIKDGDNALLDIERLFQRNDFKCTVVRFGGLVGGERYPGRFFTSARIVDGAQQPINLIHLNDCVRLIYSIIQADAFGHVFNGVADTHPTKEAFYSLAAKLNGQLPPVFSDKEQPFKLIPNQKVKEELGFEFVHSDLMEMIKDDTLWNRK